MWFDRARERARAGNDLSFRSLDNGAQIFLIDSGDLSLDTDWPFGMDSLVASMFFAAIIPTKTFAEQLLSPKRRVR